MKSLLIVELQFSFSLSVNNPKDRIVIKILEDIVTLMELINVNSSAAFN